MIMGEGILVVLTGILSGEFANSNRKNKVTALRINPCPDCGAEIYEFNAK